MTDIKYPAKRASVISASLLLVSVSVFAGDMDNRDGQNVKGSSQQGWTDTLSKITIDRPSGINVESPPKIIMDRPPEINVESPPKITIDRPSGINIESPPKIIMDRPPEINVESPPKIIIDRPSGINVESP